MEAIFLGQFCNRRILNELQDKAIIYKPKSSTAEQDIVKQKTAESLVAEVKKIVRLYQLQKIQTQIQHILGISTKIAYELRRLSTAGDYSVRKEIFQALCQAWRIIPTLALFEINEHKLMDRFAAVEQQEELKESKWINAISRLLKEEIFWIPPIIAKIVKALIAWERFKPKSIMIAPWWPGQIWFTSLLTDSSKYLILGENSLILNPEKVMKRMNGTLLIGKIAAIIIIQEKTNCGNDYHSSSTS
ncbi:MAG: hypothetical protein EZS28_031349 [Streblomastix strix]|uniref:Uncharacterized protein n=1 Tax=Streblomastix strix TaxID=222440 RepID=A0A5J4URV6_9EUKA|nr:MAG: hypothetical protein EZS28_031349 [Streblomastix strix]